MPKGTFTVNKLKNPELYQVCIGKCNKNLKIVDNFYDSPSDLYKNGKYPVCKSCLTEKLPPENPTDPNFIEAVKNLLQELNRPFITELWEAAVDEGTRRNRSIWGCYAKNICMNNNKTKTWKDSVFDTQKKSVNNTISVEESNHKNNQSFQIKIDSFDDKNREDVIRMVGYDPFLLENESDKVNLYNKLVDFLDESTLEDSFKLPAVIEIVKSFNQLDKINQAIAIITSDIRNLASNVGSVNSLVATKEKILKTALALAKDNGISVNYNNNKSKGAGTLSGIIKQLQEKGIKSAEINVFDIETCEGMRQVADISNKSIFEQLMLNENDYVEMIKEQRDMILILTKKSEQLEEENRKQKVQIKFLEMEDKRRVQVIDIDSEELAGGDASYGNHNQTK